MEQDCPKVDSISESDSDRKRVELYLKNNPQFIKSWLEKCSQQEQELCQNTDYLNVFHDFSNPKSKTKREEKNEFYISAKLDDQPDPYQHGDKELLEPCIVPRSSRKSITSDLFHQWLRRSSSKKQSSTKAKSTDILDKNKKNVLEKAKHSAVEKVKQTDSAIASDQIASSVDRCESRKLNSEVILNIIHELNSNVLYRKISQNILRLVQAERCSFFLARGPRECRYLQVKLLDVTLATDISETQEDDIISDQNPQLIEFGQGICGRAAQKKVILHLEHVNENREAAEAFSGLEHIGKGLRDCQSLVCMPICNNDNEVVAVVTIVNKLATCNKENKPNTEAKFTKHDLEVLKRFLSICGSCIQNAQLFEISVLEYKKNQLLLSLAKSLFQEQMSLDRLITKILTEAVQMLKCQRCTVYLLDLKMYNENAASLAQHYSASPVPFSTSHGNTENGKQDATCDSSSLDSGNSLADKHKNLYSPQRMFSYMTQNFNDHNNEMHFSNGTKSK